MTRGAKWVKVVLAVMVALGVLVGVVGMVHADEHMPSAGNNLPLVPHRILSNSYAT